MSGAEEPGAWTPALRRRQVLGTRITRTGESCLRVSRMCTCSRMHYPVSTALKAQDMVRGLIENVTVGLLVR
jgi:hypothetical protein